MDKFLEKHSGITYSFFRGPLKYKHKGLIHFIVYTYSENNPDFNDRKQCDRCSLSE